MPVEFYYKGLSEADRIYPHQPKKSFQLAKATLYEAWFDTLQTSPWYSEICDTKEFPSAASKETWDKFGDLRTITFEKWWLKTGHKIFSESTPYMPVREVNLDYIVKHNETKDGPPTLVLEIPLNLSPTQLTKQFEKIVAKQFAYLDEISSKSKLKRNTFKKDDGLFSVTTSFNRWQHSTATAHQQRETKMTHQYIKHWLDIYKKWTAAKAVNSKLTQSQYAQFLKLKPKGVRELGTGVSLNQEERNLYASALNESLKMARFLMAHATEGVFPCTEPHSWAVSGTRNKRKSD